MRTPLPLVALVVALGSAVASHASLAFEPNVGQSAREVRYLARAHRGVVTVDAEGFAVRIDPPASEGSFASREPACAADGALIRLAVVGADGTAEVVAGDRLAACVSYLH